MNAFAAILLVVGQFDQAQLDAQFPAGVYPGQPAFRETVPAERYPRVVFFTQKSCPPCPIAVADLRAWLPTSGQNWSIGTSPRDHLQICDIEDNPILSAQCGVTVTPSIALIYGSGGRRAVPYRGRRTFLEVLEPTFAKAVASNDLTRFGCEIRVDFSDTGREMFSPASGINTEYGVLTCWHCVKNHPFEVECEGEVVRGQVIASDAAADLALIAVSWSKPHPTVKIGATVGNSLQCVARSRDGTITAEARTVIGTDSTGQQIMVEPPFIASQSGGGLIDSEGNLAGIVSGNTIAQKPYKGLAIPVSAVRRLIPHLASAAPAEASPTPYAEVIRVLDLLPKPEKFADFGCGADARWCIAASEKWGCKSVGVEIDHGRAMAARERVKYAGLEHLVTIIEGDAITTEVDADVGVAYLYQEVLDKLAPKFAKMKGAAFYLHRPNGLPVVQNGDSFIYTRSAMAATVQVNQPRMVEYGGQLYSGPVCNDPRCAMCRYLRAATGVR